MSTKINKVIELDSNFKSEIEKFEKKQQKNFELKKLKLENDFSLKKEDYLKKLDKDFVSFKKLVALKVEKKYQDLDRKIENLNSKINVDNLVDKSFGRYF